MRFISRTSLDGVTEQLFTLGEIPGVLWTPDDDRGPRPLILMGHGGGQHKQAPGIVARARRLAAAGENAAAAVVAMHDLLAGQAGAEWQAVLTAVQQLGQVGAGPAGYWGISMGCGLGVPFVAAEPRVRAAVLGLLGPAGLAQAAARITVPVQFLAQWDDVLVPRAESLALFEAFSSA